MIHLKMNHFYIDENERISEYSKKQGNIWRIRSQF